MSIAILPKVKKMVNFMLLLALLVSLILLSNPLTAVAETTSGVTVSLSHDTARPGDSVTVSGVAAPNTWVSVKAVDTKGNVVVFDGVKSDSNGAYTCTFIVPDVTSESLTIVVGSGSDVANGVITVIQNAPALAADAEDNIVSHPISLTFTDDAAWRSAITDVTVNGVSIAGNYTVDVGTINIDAASFPMAGDYVIVVKANGYLDATVTQSMLNAAYTTTPVPDALYQVGVTPHGITTMTVNNGFSGLSYFSVTVSPVRSHVGDETVVFTHLRDDLELGLNATRADFDSVNAAAAGFNVDYADVVKVFVVDQLSNALDFNPTVLQ